jgi:hypothetical protein
LITGKNSQGSLSGDNVPPSSLSLTSSFIPVGDISGEFDSAIALTSITPSISILTSGVDAVKTFKADATGSFSGNIVPEPASWALMLAGFGLAGGSLRLRAKRQVAV